MDLGEIGIVADLHADDEIIVVLVSGGIVADHLTVAVTLTELLFVLVQVCNTGDHICKGNDIGIALNGFPILGDEETGGNAVDFFNMDLFVNRWIKLSLLSLYLYPKGSQYQK